MAELVADTSLSMPKIIARPYGSDKLRILSTNPEEVFPTRLVVPGATWYGAIGHDVGPDGYGVLMGKAVPVAPGSFIVQDGSVYTDQTTAAGEATANDMDLWPATPAADDAIYFLHGNPFCGIMVNFGIATVGENMTVVVEYYNGTAWTALAATLYSDETALMLSAATGLKLFSFAPPTDWAPVAVSTGVGELTTTGYGLRFRCTAYTALTTPPKGSQAYMLSHLSAYGMTMPITGSIEWLFMQAQAAVGTAKDLKILLINCKSGASAVATWTKTTSWCVADGLGLLVEKDDQVMLKVGVEDGSSEPTDVVMKLGLVAM